jgi:hypothetical protein
MIGNVSYLSQFFNIPPTAKSTPLILSVLKRGLKKKSSREFVEKMTY